MIEAPKRREVAAAYVRGLCWVLQYYYQGVASWTWYYPYHYAPCASDLHSLARLQHEKTWEEFELGGPFLPRAAHGRAAARVGARAAGAARQADVVAVVAARPLLPS